MLFTYFDYSHPGARAHIAECIRTMKEEWGITYFKVDFMRYGLEDDIKKRNKTLKSIKAFVPGITSVERFRLGLQTMRDAIGQDNYFLGCSAVFGPTIGFVDGMRTGADIHPRFDAFGERAHGNVGNFYLNSVFNLDADYIVARAAADEDATIFGDDKKSGGNVTANEAQMWADFVRLYSNFRLNSDNLQTLRPERATIVVEAMKSPKIDETCRSTSGSIPPASRIPLNSSYPAAVTISTWVSLIGATSPKPTPYPPLASRPARLN